jgi:hypothetical protein
VHSADSRLRPAFVVQEELDTNIDIGRNTVSFRKIGEDDLSLLRTARGHLAVIFLDFDKTKLDQF